jgi:alcohol dehydrogenase (cytochrome c)
LEVKDSFLRKWVGIYRSNCIQKTSASLNLEREFHALPIDRTLTMSSQRTQKKKRFAIVGGMLVILALTAVIEFRVLSNFVHNIQDVNSQRVIDEIEGRLRLYGKKLVGDLPEFSWYELVSGTWPGKHLNGTWPGSGFISVQKVMEGRGLDASVIDPRGDQDDIQHGKQLFQEKCGACHGRDGKGGHAPSLARANYSVGESDFALYKTLRDGIPGTAMNSLKLSILERWQVISFLRSLQDRSTANSVDVSVPPINVTWPNLMAAQNEPNSWLTYSGTLDGQRHSRIGEITSSNVARLKLLWAHQFSISDNSTIEATPLVKNNVIYLTLPPCTVVALDATTGREIWRLARELPDNLPICCGKVNRGLAILGDTLFYGSLDAKLIAVDARTGRVRWETQIANPNEGYSVTGAPLIAKGLVILGVSGGEFGARGFISAYDANSGKMRWHFDTIPKPGDPGHETWKNDAWKTGGGPTWVTGSVDPNLNLLYWGVGNPSPNYAGAARPGDNLFTNSVVALDVDTGKLAWFFQFTPHDEHDWDSNQTPILADINIGGAIRKVICWANRNGFYYVLDRTNGDFLAGTSFVEVSWASSLDSKGRPVPTDSAHVTTAGVVTKPWIGGGTNWLPPSFDPSTQTFFVHATEGSSVYTAAPVEHLARGSNGIYVGSGSSESEPAVNYVIALDASSGRQKWKHASPRGDPRYSGVLSTTGGIIFSAAAGIVFALDSETGKELWRAGLGGPVQATPISFELNGKQAVAIAAGETFFVFGL